MIDKGVNSSLFLSKEKGSLRLTLKLGMLAIGVSLGIITGILLRESFDRMNDGIVLAAILLFGGISLIVNFLIERKMDEDAKKDAE